MSEKLTGTESYENLIKQPLQIIRVCFVIYSLFVFLMPVYKDSGIGIDSIVSFICWVIMFGCCLSCHGLIFDFLAIFPVVTIRSLFVLYGVFIKKGEVNYVFFAVIVIIELVLNMLYLSDKDNYEYVKEEEDGYEFY